MTDPLRRGMWITCTLLVGASGAQACDAQPAATVPVAWAVEAEIPLGDNGSLCGTAILGSHLAVCDSVARTVRLHALPPAPPAQEELALPAEFDRPIALFPGYERSAAVVNYGWTEAVHVADRQSLSRIRAPSRPSRSLPLVRRPVSRGCWVTANLELPNGVAQMRARTMREGALADSMVISLSCDGAAETDVRPLVRTPLRGAYNVVVESDGVSHSVVLQHPLEPETLVAASAGYAAVLRGDGVSLDVWRIDEAEAATATHALALPDPQRVDVDPERVWQWFIDEGSDGTMAHRRRLRAIVPEGSQVRWSELVLGQDATVWIAQWNPPASGTRRWYMTSLPPATADWSTIEVPASWRLLTSYGQRAVFHDTQEATILTVEVATR